MIEYLILAKILRASVVPRVSHSNLTQKKVYWCKL